MNVETYGEIHRHGNEYTGKHHNQYIYRIQFDGNGRIIFTEHWENARNKYNSVT